MASSLLWNALDAAQIKRLANETDPAATKSLLSEYIPGFDSDSKSQEEVATDFHFYNLAFARKLRFSPDKVSVFMSIMAAVLNRDRSDGLRTMQGSFDYFKQLVHRHSVERPPHSVGIFNVDDVTQLVDYVTNSYYRHFRLYKYVLAKKPQLILTQRQQGLVEAPPKLPPLASALQES